MPGSTHLQSPVLSEALEMKNASGQTIVSSANRREWRKSGITSRAPVSGSDGDLGITKDLSLCPHVCVFCGSGPLTNEHTFPKWLVERFTGTPMTATAPNGKKWSTTRINIPVGVVCKTCNNGWMSELEAAAKPILGRMASGERLFLDTRMQSIISSWAVKTAMIFEFTLPEDVGAYYTREERSAFRREPHTPPGDTTVEVLSYLGSQRASFAPGKIGIRTIAGRDWAPSRVCLFTFDRMAWRVHSNRWKATTGNDYIVWPHKHFGIALQVWEPTPDGVLWPPAHALLDDGTTRKTE